MKGMSLFLKELREFYRFFRIDKKNREIVVYSEDASYYSYFEGLINELTGHYNLKVHYITSDPHDPMLSKKEANIKSFYIKHLLGFFIFLLDSKLILMTMPDLNQFHIKRSIRGSNHIYLFHNIGSYFHVIRHGGLFYYDTFFCVGPHQIKELHREEELYDLPKREIVKFGYYRLDKTYAEYKKWKLTKKKNGKYKAKILVAPGWGPWEERNSMLDLCGSKLIRLLLESNYEVILRPHPMTRIKFPEFLDSLYDEFKNFNNFGFEENISSMESFYTSDLMIGDWSGVVYEYAFGTEKPVIFIDVKMKVNNPKYKDFKFEPIDLSIRNHIGIVVGLDQIKDIDLVITKVITHQDEYIKKIIKARNEHVYNLGNSSSAGANYIREFLQK